VAAQAGCAADSITDVVMAPGKGLGWTVGNSGSVCETQDAGESWYQKQPSTGAALQCITYHEQDNPLLVGERGTVWRFVGAPPPPPPPPPSPL
jgi:photosystem II stability/assembly factor-like uncharacterized protein